MMPGLRASPPTRTSAGGHELQPSEVNNSTTTGCAVTVAEIIKPSNASHLDIVTINVRRGPRVSDFATLICALRYYAIAPLISCTELRSIFASIRQARGVRSSKTRSHERNHRRPDPDPN